MATPVIQSTATAFDNSSASSLTISKPSGLAVDDLMIAVIGRDSGTTHTATLSGWTVIDNGRQSQANNAALYKIADSGDAAASNFAFSFSTSVSGCAGIIYRITGHAAANPVGESTLDTLNSNTTNPSFSPSFNPRAADSLLIMSLFSDSNSSSTAVSGYTISGTNPTWTEQYDQYLSNGDSVFATATAAANSASTITSYDMTLSNAMAAHVGILLAIPEQTDVTATPASITLTGGVPTPSLSADVNVTPDSINLTGTVNDPDIEAFQRVWADQEQNNGVWTDQEK